MFTYLTFQQYGWMVTEGTAHFLLTTCWCGILIYMFYAQERVCAHYVMPSVSVMIHRQRQGGGSWGEEGLAGATLVALGCNGPDFLTNFISQMYGTPEIGLGAVIGSEIFSTLLVIGLVSVTSAAPLQLEVGLFTRDFLFYVLSVGALTGTLWDEKVDRWEAVVLFCLGLAHILVVYRSGWLMRQLGLSVPNVWGDFEVKPDTIVHGYRVSITELFHNRVAGAPLDPSYWDIDAKPDGFWCEPLAGMGSPFGKKFNRQDALLGTTVPWRYLKEIETFDRGVLVFHFDIDCSPRISLRIKIVDDRDRSELEHLIQEYSCGTVWDHRYDPSARGVCNEVVRVVTDRRSSIMKKISTLLCFPVDFILAFTLSGFDVYDGKEPWPWMCLLASVVWVLIFAYLMCRATWVLALTWKVDVTQLSIIILGTGMTFFNAFASMRMASRGLPDRFLTRIVRYNLKNIVLSLAVPWFFVTIPNGTLDVSGSMIVSGVVWMSSASCLLLILILANCCKLGRGAGYVLCLAFCGYVIFIIPYFFSDATYPWQKILDFILPRLTRK